jgi:EAL domain-containing protein (putative c-di-GMP-specific phosphodiesterase class I)
VRAARPFGVEVTAKRVETPDEVDLLRELECAFTWGDAFAAPVSADRFAQTVRGAA